MRFIFKIAVLLILLLGLQGYSQSCSNFIKLFEDELYGSKTLRDYAVTVDNPDTVFDAWRILYKEGTLLHKDLSKIKEVESNLAAVKLAGSYSAWKTNKLLNLSSEDVLDKILETGTQDRVIGDYTIDMVSDKISDKYIVNGFNVNLLGNSKESITGIKNVLRTLETDALNSGAKVFIFRLHSIKNEGFLSPRLWKLLGYTFKNEGNAIILVSKQL